MKTLQRNQTRAHHRHGGLSLAALAGLPSPYFVAGDLHLTIKKMADAKVIAFNQAGNNLQCLVAYENTDGTGYFQSLMPIALSSIPNDPVTGPAYIKSNLQGIFNTYCTDNSVDVPTSFMWLVEPTAVGRASFATVATSGSYTDLSNKPTLGSSFEGTTQRTGAFPIFKTGTVGSGVIAFHLTDTGLSGGTALFPTAVIADSVNVTVSDATASYQMSWAFSNSNKTLTVTANKLTTSNILTGILGQAAANSAVVKLTVWGY